MANQYNSLSHTRWMCKYHIVIVFTPKYRRKIIYNQYRESIQEIIKTLCRYKGVEIIEGYMMPDHVQRGNYFSKNRIYGRCFGLVLK